METQPYHYSFYWHARTTKNEEKIKQHPGGVRRFREIKGKVLSRTNLNDMDMGQICGEYLGH